MVARHPHLTLCLFAKKPAQQGFARTTLVFCGSYRDVEPPPNFGITQLVALAHPDDGTLPDRQGPEPPAEDVAGLPAALPVPLAADGTGWASKGGRSSTKQATRELGGENRSPVVAFVHAAIVGDPHEPGLQRWI